MKKTIAAIIIAVLSVAMLCACGEKEVKTNTQQAMLSATSVTVKMGSWSEVNVQNYAGEVKWSSSDTSIAAVTAEGRINPVSIGSAAITAKLDNGESMTCVVDVQPGVSVIEKITVTSLYSDVSDITVDYQKDKTVALKASCYPDVNENIVWSSSDELLAMVDQSGNVTIYGNGIVEIKATAMNGISGVCKVRTKNVPAGVAPVVMPDTEDEIPVIEDKEEEISAKFKSTVPVSSPSAKTSVIVSDKNVYLKVGESFTLTYAVGNTDAEDVEWVSSDKTVAIVKSG
ncbi:MAG: Ig-like domain-containing protein, partial [Clostridia bacterium]|nr:Ig-like domain-containing protein [Clostridia bacterium]